MDRPSVRSYCSGRKLVGMETFLWFMRVAPRQVAHLFVVPFDPCDSAIDAVFECNARRPAEFAACLRSIHQVSHVLPGSIHRDLARLLDISAKLAADCFNHLVHRMVPTW